MSDKFFGGPSLSILLSSVESKEFGISSSQIFSPKTMDIRLDNLNGSEIRELLQEHLHSALLHSPPESVHALDIAGLRKPEITFWSARENGELLGCGALKELDSQHGEIKSMRTASRRVRKGVAQTLLHHIIGEAGRRGYRRLSLETGSMQAFEPARQLYA